MKKAVLIGCGAISENHIGILKEMPEVNFSAICDIDPKAAKRTVEREGLSLNVYTDYKEMLEKEKPDAVHICTPHFLHAPMAIYALERGINVFLEKPACMTPEELPALMEAEKNSSAILCISFQNRFLEAVGVAEKMIASGEYGKVMGGRAIVTWSRGGEYYTESPWRGKIATEGGSVLINQSIHSLDLLLYFLGEPENITGMIGTHTTGPYNDTEDTAHIIMKYPDDKVGIFFATNSYFKSARVEVDIACEKKNLRLSGDRLSVNGEIVFEGTKGVRRGKEVWGKGHSILIDEFYKALEEGRESPVPLESAVKSLKVIWELYRQNRK
jgi:predicted dehydrogenase